MGRKASSRIRSYALISLYCGGITMALAQNPTESPTIFSPVGNFSSSSPSTTPTSPFESAESEDDGPTNQLELPKFGVFMICENPPSLIREKERWYTNLEFYLEEHAINDRLQKVMEEYRISAKVDITTFHRKTDPCDRLGEDAYLLRILIESYIELSREGNQPTAFQESESAFIMPPPLTELEMSTALEGLQDFLTQQGLCIQPKDVKLPDNSIEIRDPSQGRAKPSEWFVYDVDSGTLRPDSSSLYRAICQPSQVVEFDLGIGAQVGIALLFLLGCGIILLACLYCCGCITIPGRNRVQQETISSEVPAPPAATSTTTIQPRSAHPNDNRAAAPVPVPEDAEPAYQP